MTEVKQSFSLKGMHCASCVRSTERALKKTSGVKDAVVNLATEKATVTYDNTVCTPKELANSIAKTGYTLDLEEINEEIQEKEKKHELAKLKKKSNSKSYIRSHYFLGELSRVDGYCA